MTNTMDTTMTMTNTIARLDDHLLSEGPLLPTGATADDHLPATVDDHHQEEIDIHHHHEAIVETEDHPHPPR